MENGATGIAKPEVARPEVGQVHYAKVPDLDLYRCFRINVSRRIGLGKTRMMASYTQLDHPSLLYPVEEALRTGIISDEQEDRIAATLAIFRGIRKDAGTPVWVAADLANYIEDSEINLVRQSADALSVVFQEESAAVVQGYRIDPQCLKRADTLDVHVILVKKKRDYSLEN